jgi:hypothetical protein
VLVSPFTIGHGDPPLNVCFCQIAKSDADSER